ncbi:hypothetical protein RRG08_025152 [Elysia crispata]|uniref:Uncharacterized protein n=1 Tax=Elysia crispata TaxID=231223 RepID=A0AAE0YAT7_9GAST|nr:hypothetical protein RRG08_025152 [Elysia crispata]
MKRLEASLYGPSELLKHQKSCEHILPDVSTGTGSGSDEHGHTLESFTLVERAASITFWVLDAQFGQICRIKQATSLKAG